MGLLTVLGKEYTAEEIAKFIEIYKANQRIEEINAQSLAAVGVQEELLVRLEPSADKRAEAVSVISALKALGV